MMNRTAHLDWSKSRALAYLDQPQPNVNDAWASFCSDLIKHPDTADHAGMELGMMLILGGHLHTPQQMREHITGCH